MKTIVISGARSNVGKTTLARDLRRLLPGAVHVKIGHGLEKPGEWNAFYRAGTPYERIAAERGGASFLVIESNRVLDELKPDLAVYLPADDPKPSARAARGKADYIRGETVDAGFVEEIARRLCVSIETAHEIAHLIAGVAGGQEWSADEKA